jgi:hypothetical protein
MTDVVILTLIVAMPVVYLAGRWRQYVDQLDELEAWETSWHRQHKALTRVVAAIQALESQPTNGEVRAELVWAGREAQEAL